jgi:iron(III) transport system substrate-binding protein
VEVEDVSHESRYRTAAASQTVRLAAAAGLAALLLSACAPAAAPSPTAAPAKPTEAPKPAAPVAPAASPAAAAASPAAAKPGESPAASKPAAKEAPTVAGTFPQLDTLYSLQPQERQAKLVEEAKKEGQVVWYTSYTQVEAEPFIASFNKLYPDVKVQYVRQPSDALMDKLISEYQANKFLVDVVLNDQDQFDETKRNGVVGKYCSPEREATSDQMKDRDCEWTGRHHNPKVFGYNTQKVQKEQAPKGWNDLLDPRWKGKLGIPADDGPKWIINMEQVLGKDKGQDFVKKMAEQKVQLHQSNSAAAQLVGAGDAEIGYFINIPAVTNIQKQGGPIESVSPDPLTTSITSVFMASKAQHPSASALLIDYLLSKDGQLKMAELSTRFGGRTDMQYPDQKFIANAKILFLSPEMVRGPAIEAASKQFKELFGGR